MAIEVISTIRPKNGSKFPVVLSNEIQGGIHLVETLKLLDGREGEIAFHRRQIGMLCHVLDARNDYEIEKGLAPYDDYYQCIDAENNKWEKFNIDSGVFLIDSLNEFRTKKINVIEYGENKEYYNDVEIIVPTNKLSIERLRIGSLCYAKDEHEYYHCIEIDSLNGNSKWEIFHTDEGVFYYDATPLNLTKSNKYEFLNKVMNYVIPVKRLHEGCLAYFKLLANEPPDYYVCTKLDVDSSSWSLFNTDAGVFHLATKSELDAGNLPKERLRDGSICYITEEERYYQCRKNGDNITWDLLTIRGNILNVPTRTDVSKLSNGVIDKGTLCYIVNEKKYLRYDGSKWVDFTIEGVTLYFPNATPETLSSTESYMIREGALCYNGSKYYYCTSIEGSTSNWKEFKPGSGILYVDKYDEISTAFKDFDSITVGTLCYVNEHNTYYKYNVNNTWEKLSLGGGGGGIINIAKPDMFNTIPIGNLTPGALCYVESEGKYYKYNGNNWELFEIDGRDGKDGDPGILYVNTFNELPKSSDLQNGVLCYIVESKSLYQNIDGEWRQIISVNNEVVVLDDTYQRIFRTDTLEELQKIDETMGADIGTLGFVNNENLTYIYLEEGWTPSTIFSNMVHIGPEAPPDKRMMWIDTTDDILNEHTVISPTGNLILDEFIDKVKELTAKVAELERIIESGEIIKPPSGDDSEPSEKIINIITEDGDFFMTEDGDMIIDEYVEITVKPDKTPSEIMLLENGDYFVTELGEYIVSEDYEEVEEPEDEPEEEKPSTTGNKVIGENGDTIVTENGDTIIQEL